jgi:hypothetical protein
MPNTITRWPVPGLVSSRPGLLIPAADPILKTDYNAAIRCLIDLSGSLGRPSQATTFANGETITDLSGVGANPTFSLGASQTVNYAGGGMDMSAYTDGGSTSHVDMPAAVNADIWNAVGGQSQLFLDVVWVKIPTLANWNTTGTLSSIWDGGGNYTTGPDRLVIAMANGGVLSVRRQIASATADTPFLITPKGGEYGNWAQVMFLRINAGCWCSLQSALGVNWSSRNIGGAAAAKGADNTQNFSAQGPRLGNGAFWVSAGQGGNNGLRLARAYTVNMARETRDPIRGIVNVDYGAKSTDGSLS